MRKKSAFTLIELLVVVAIIAVLISILVPSLKAAKEQAYVVLCLSQERQMGIASAMYGNEHNGRFVSNLPSAPWDVQLAPYLGLRTSAPTDLLRCPKDYRKGTDQWQWSRSYSLSRQHSLKPDEWGIAYFGGDPNSGYKPNIRLADVKHPAKTLFVIEVGYGNEFGGGGNRQWSYNWGVVDGWLAEINIPFSPDHGEKMNFLLADFHVETFPPQRAYQEMLWSRVD